MTPLSITQSTTNTIKTHKMIDKTTTSWAFIALVGQWFFAIYILTMYVLTYFFELNLGQFSPATGSRKLTGGELTTFFAHIVPAIFLGLFGMFQLVPKIRQRYPTFHRWNGRVFFVLGLSGAITGLYLTWGAGLRFSNIGSLGISLNGILILGFISMAWYTAVTKQFSKHKRWAIHSFILVNGVWTFRLYLMGWYVVNQGPNGNKPTVDGPMDIVLSFACYLLPMAIVELIFWAKRQQQNATRANIVLVSTIIGCVITLIGVVSATMLMWLPRINQVFEAGV